MANSSVKAIVLMADYGHDPTETAIPVQIFRDAGFDVSFATENGKTAACDARMLTGWTQKLLGAAGPVIETYNSLTKTASWQKPLAWTSPDFDLKNYDLVFLPGGHDKGVRQILDSQRVHQLLGEYFPQTKKPGKKCCTAICHGVQVLAHTKDASGKSILHGVTTTALPGVFENGVDYGTRLFLGDYYKTYGAGTANVETVVRQALDDPEKQWHGSSNPAAPFVVEDEGYNYLSGRWPGDAQLLAEKTVEMVRKVKA